MIKYNNSKHYLQIIYFLMFFALFSGIIYGFIIDIDKVLDKWPLLIFMIIPIGGLIYVTIFVQTYSNLYFKGNKLIQRTFLGITNSIDLRKIDEIYENEYNIDYVVKMEPEYRIRDPREQLKILLFRQDDKRKMVINYLSFKDDWEDIKSKINTLSSSKIEIFEINNEASNIDWKLMMMNKK